MRVIAAEPHLTGGGGLAPGTEQWRVSATPGYYIAQTIRGMPGMNGTTYLLEMAFDGSGSVLRVVDDDGHVQWSAPVPIAADETATLAMGDALGGVLLNVSGPANTTAIVRMGTDGAESWRYGSAVAQGQAGDGTIYALGSEHRDSWMVVLDGATGAARARVPLARSTELYLNPRQGRETHVASTGGFDKLVIDGHGNARVLVTSGDLTELVGQYDEPVPVPMSGPSAVSADQFEYGVVSHSTRLELWTLSPTGALSIASIAHDAVQGDASTAKEYVPTIMVPDDDGTVVLTWREEWRQYVNGGGNIDHSTGHFGRVPLGAGSATVLPLSNDVSPETAAMGEGNTLFVADGNGSVSALDATSGAIKWSATGGDILATTAGGGVVIQSPDTRTTYDGNGAQLSSVSATPGTTLGDSSGLFNEFTSISAHAAGPGDIDYASVGWNVPDGTDRGAAAAPVCIPPIHPLRKLPAGLSQPYYFDFDISSQNGFDLEQQEVIQDEAGKWVTQGLYNHPVKIATTEVPNTTIKKGTFFNAGSSNPVEANTIFSRTFTAFRYERFGVEPEDWGIVFNRELFQLVTADKREKFQLVALHEAGHLIGLDHPDKNCAFGTTIMTRSVLVRRSPHDLTQNDKDAVGVLKSRQQQH